VQGCNAKNKHGICCSDLPSTIRCSHGPDASLPFQPQILERVMSDVESDGNFTFSYHDKEEPA
jgi:hypothetical protein